MPSVVLENFGRSSSLVWVAPNFAKPLCGSVVTLVNEKARRIVYSPDNPSSPTAEEAEERRGSDIKERALNELGYQAD
jgi:hypothetical protein